MTRLSNFDLINFAQKLDIDPFDCVMHKHLPRVIKKEDYIIVNLDHGENGTHWVCGCNIPNKDYVVYFDSFGFPPSDLIARYLETSGKEIVYNDSDIQNVNKESCGYWCLYVLEKMKNKGNYYKILKKFNDGGDLMNEKRLQKYMQKLSLI